MAVGGGSVPVVLSGVATAARNAHFLRKAEIDIFLEPSWFFHDPADIGNLISGSSAFSKTSLNLRKFMVHILLKPGLENFARGFPAAPRQ